MSEMIIKSKFEGKEVTLELTQNEVATAISICDKSSVEEVIVMKRPHKGGALFFVDPNRAQACQDRHRFDYSFTIKLSALKKFKPSADPAPAADPKDAEIVSLKEKITELKEEKEKSAEAVKSVGDKDAEIELLKEEVGKIASLETKLSEATTAVAGLTEANAKLVEENAKLKK